MPSNSQNLVFSCMLQLSSIGESSKNRTFFFLSCEWGNLILFCVFIKNYSTASVGLEGLLLGQKQLWIIISGPGGWCQPLI